MIIRYKAKNKDGETIPYECERPKASEAIEALVASGRLPVGTTVEKVINTGCQRLDYTMNRLPHTASNLERAEKEGKKVSAEATKI